MPGLLIDLIIVLVVVGLALWILQQIPMDATIARIIRVVIIVFVCVWLLYVLVGFLPSGGLFYPYPRRG
jgi:hypothetical protein